ncbi:MAG: ATP-dependent DNA helicase [Rhodobiaceae bacterium]|nr:ATP-dependent DNA helicase [Rhodobiaceae bacterium]RPF96548.1 MAG: ATP-dependent DNA helicase [Rhizobiales bacterium TMED227]
MNTDYLSYLNEQQKAAVLHTEGPLLILAGAGTGKTSVLTSRLAHIIYKKLAFPNNILAVTFTNKAAKEMQLRIGNIIGNAVEGMNWLGTFHSIGTKLLRMHAELVDLKSDFTILDTDDQLKVIKEVIRLLDIDEKQFPPRLFLSFIDQCKNKGLTPEKVNTEIDLDFIHEKSIEVYKNYQKRLKTLNSVDFGDLLMLPLQILIKNEAILDKFQSTFKYILVDEYQDTNTVQYQLLRILSQKNRNIACVGDDDQSIYGWRGADVNNILNFEKDFDGSKIIRLEKNYRSTVNILGAARSLITNNIDRLGKELSSSSDEEGDKVKLVSVWSAEDEAIFISDEIDRKLISKTDLDQISILVRASFQMREIEDRLILNSIPYRVIGGPKFYERQEIIDVIAYLQLLLNQNHDLKFERILNVPKRGLGETTIRMLNDASKIYNLSLFDVSKKLIQTDELKPQQRTQLSSFIAMIENWKQKLNELDHVTLTELILEDSGYIEMWEKDKTPTSLTRIENIKELVGQIAEFNSLHEFIEHISLVLEVENDKSSSKVSLMTLHSAKGLEFDCVFMPGLEEGVFPNQRSLDEKGNSGLEEERRLAHVGMTRAKKYLYLIHSQNRRVYGNWMQSIPSRFISEISREFIDDDSTLIGTTINTYGNGVQNTSAFDYQKKKLSAIDRLKAAGHFNNNIEALEEISDYNNVSVLQNQRVFHTKFGYGIVIDNENDRVEVDFDKAGKKIVLSSYLEVVKND